MAEPSHPGRELLRAAKAAASTGEPALGLAIGRPVAGMLRTVVTRPGALDPSDVRMLTDWRNRFTGAFLSEFEASEQRTERWLVESVGRDDSRILFMVEDAAGRTVGHMGLAAIDWEGGRAEADSVVRGAEAPRGLTAHALDAMWRWGRAALGLSKLAVRVRSDNSAIAFYEKCGFGELRRVPLRREETGDEVRWVEDPTLTGNVLSLVHMELRSDGE